MINLYKHQQVALNYLRFNKSFLLNMEQGTGKTIPTICIILELIQSKKINNGLVVCPKAVVASWKRDLEKFTSKQQTLFYKHITIINYDRVWRCKELDPQYDLIVLDEAHFIKNRTSKRSAFLLNLSCYAKYRYELTGTPVSNGQLENLWSLLTFLQPIKGKSVCSEIFKERDGGRGSYSEFLKNYCYLDNYYKPYKYKNVDRLQQFLNSCSYRVKKEQCLDLPAKLPDEIYELELQPAKLYKDIAKRSASIEFNFVASNPLVRLIKLRQLASGFFIDDDKNVNPLPCEKQKALTEFLEGYDRKLVIFAEFKQSIRNICDVLDNAKRKYVVLDGDQKNKEIWRLFQDDKSINVIVCQYISGSAGIDLYASDTILFYEPTLRSNILEQARDRIHRNGQTHKCSYIHFITKGTVEVAIYRALKNYSDFNEKLFTQYLTDYQKAGKRK